MPKVIDLPQTTQVNPGDVVYVVQNADSKHVLFSDFSNSIASNFSNDLISGNTIDGGTISNFKSTGITDNASGTNLTVKSDGGIVVDEGNSFGQGTLSVDRIYTMDNNPITPLTRRHPGALVYMFNEPLFNDNSSGNGLNRNQPTWWFRQFVDAIRKFNEIQTFIVINPQDGPGTSTNSNYTLAIEWLKGAGATVMGYIDTDYTTANPDGITGAGSKSITDLKNEIDNYSSWYPLLDGIWFDKVPTVSIGTTGTNAKNIYKELTHHTKRYAGFWYTGGNPGELQSDNSYFTENVFDIINIYQNDSDPTIPDLLGITGSDDNVIENSPRRKAMVVHNIGQIGKGDIASRVYQYSQYVDLIFYWPFQEFDPTVNWDDNSYAQYLTATGRGLISQRDSILTKWQKITDDYEAWESDRLLIDSNDRQFTVTLPANPDVGTAISIADSGGNLETNDVDISGNGNMIEGQSSYNMGTSGVRLDLIFDGSQWLIR